MARRDQAGATVTAPPTRPADDRRAARKALERSVARAVAAVVVTVALYYLLPLDPGSDLGAVARVAAGIVAVLAVAAWELRAVGRSPRPWIRAVDALAVSVGLMICVFALVYLNVAARDPAAFSEPLGRTSALYFTMVTLATVGYGDIVARSDLARIVVMVQIIFNVAVIGTTVRLIIGAARRTADARRGVVDRDL